MKVVRIIIAAVLAFILGLNITTGMGNRCKGVNEETYKVYDNVILFIGDGMGENHLKAAKDILDISLNMETVPVRGQSMTDNWIGETTDSAAGGSALAMGIRTLNGYVGVSPYDPLGVFSKPKLLTEAAKEIGKSAGIVTTDKTSGATPADFSVHTSSRDNSDDICIQQLEGNLDLIWGGKNSYITPENAAANGFTYVSSVSDIENLEAGTRSFGQFSYDDFHTVSNTDVTPTIEYMTKSAIDILDDNENGFFLMVEGAHIDKFSHSQDIDGAVKQLSELDKAIAYALDYAENDGNTLVVVTADHETGNVTYNEETKKYECLSGSHTDKNVPLLVSDAAAGFENGQAVKNRQVGAQLALCLGVDADEFPMCCTTSVTDFFFAYKKLFK